LDISSFQSKGLIQAQRDGYRRQKGLINSHSNNKLPEVNNLQIEFSRMSNPANERSSIADRSLDRAKASNFLLAQSKDAVMSRQDLIKNEYRKVIKNHPSTLINTSDTYDDTDFLNRMFAKEKEI
jgi:hypothetical protein